MAMPRPTNKDLEENRIPLKEASKRPEPRIFHYTEIPTDNSFEENLSIEFGVNEWTVGSRRITTGHTTIKPGQKTNVRHVHRYAEAVMFIIKGYPVVFMGEEAKETQCKPGTFIYIPEGTVHGICNPSTTETVEIVFSYGGVPNQYAAGTALFSDDHDFPRKDWEKDYQK